MALINEASYERVALADMAPADYNPRTISDDALEGLEASMTRFGDVQPIVWNRRTSNIVGGHQRFKVLTAQGVEDAMVAVVDLPPEAERALNVALNNPHITGEFTDGLQDILRGIQDADAELFRDIHLDKLLAEEAEEAPGEDDAPPLPEDAVTQLGDVWVLGNHRIICGSSGDHAAVMRLIGDDAATCMWTDPPYGVNYENRPKASKSRTSRVTNDVTEGLSELLASVFSLADGYVLAPGSAVYVAHPAGGLAYLFETEVLRVGWRIKSQLVWVKSSMVISRWDYQPRHEPLLYAFKVADKGRHGRFGGYGWYGPDNATTVFEYDKPTKHKDHPTMKPVALIEHHLLNSTRPLDIVYDPFLGSGSTLIACEKTGRRCLGVELEPAYCDVVVRRWEEFTGKSARRGDALIEQPRLPASPVEQGPGGP